MTRKNFYVLVDKNTNTVLNQASELPENWNNIHGLSALSDEELSDLEWAGRPNLGWIKFNSEFPFSYTFSENWISFAKESIKEAYANQRWEAENKGILYKGIQINTDDRTKTSILMKKELMSKSSKETFSWKHNGEIIKFNVTDVINISNALNDYVQQCFEVEAELIEKIDKVSTIEDLAKFELDIEWPSNSY